MNLPVLIPVNASEFLEERGYDDECDTHVDVERLHDIGNSTGCEFEFECDPSLHALVVILGEGTGKIIGHQLFSNLCFQLKHHIQQTTLQSAHAICSVRGWTVNVNGGTVFIRLTCCVKFAL